MSRALSQPEISKRLIRLRNLQYLHVQQNARVGLLEEKITTLTQENAVLRSENAVLARALEDCKLQIEELRTMVFGKKKHTADSEGDDLPPPPSKQRTRDSYRRAVPTQEEVTQTIPHTIDVCDTCHHEFSKKRMVVFFEEDIPVPAQKIIRKHLVERGIQATPVHDGVPPSRYLQAK